MGADLTDKKIAKTIAFVIKAINSTDSTILTPPQKETGAELLRRLHGKL